MFIRWTSSIYDSLSIDTFTDTCPAYTEHVTSLTTRLCSGGGMLEWTLSHSHSSVEVLQTIYNVAHATLATNPHHKQHCIQCHHKILSSSHDCQQIHPQHWFHPVAIVTSISASPLSSCNVCPLFLFIWSINGVLQTCQQCIMSSKGVYLLWRDRVLACCITEDMARRIIPKPTPLTAPTRPTSFVHWRTTGCGKKTRATMTYAHGIRMSNRR